MSDGRDIQKDQPTWDESFPRPSWGPEPPEAQGPLAPGTQIGRFRIEGPLGRGGMGVVYLARDMKLNRFVALKSLPPEARRKTDIQARLQREGRLLAQLNHPNIATLYDILEGVEGTVYLVLEYVAGQTLAEKLASGRLSVPQALSVALQAATALAAAHEHGIIHRDIKPGNIMITRSNHVKVLDFGLGRAFDAEAPGSGSPVTRPGWPLGTLAYMSPELALGKAADQGTDIWSLGVVIYEMATGQRPFRGDTELAVLHATVQEEPEDLRAWRADIPAALEQTVLRMLQKEPGQRYQSMADVVRELKGLARSDATSASWGREAPSIAVLPFVDMSPKGDQEYFCDGIAEELINALTRIKGLRVIARTSAFSYKGKNLGVRQIGQELNVATLLEGSVRWAEDRLRVTAQLIDAHHDHHLWSERYDRPRGDIFAIQDDITAAIVDRLKPTLVAPPKTKMAPRHPVNLDAYHLYLRGCYFRGKGTPGALQRAFEYFQQAIGREPGYALPYVGLALSYSLLPFYSRSSPAQCVPRAKEMVSKALQIDEMLAEARGALGFIKTWYDWDWAGAEQEIRLAIELNPGSDRLHLWYAYCLTLQGRYGEARDEMAAALELDPMSILLHRELGMVSCFAHDYDQAIDTLQETLEMDPSIMYAHTHLGVAYMGKCRYEEALKEFQKEREVARGSHTWADTLEGIVRAQMGQKEQAREILERLHAESRQEYVSPFHLACLGFVLGQDDLGFQWLNAAYDGQDLWLCFLKAIPGFDRISTDPRCLELLKKTSLG